MARSWSSKAKTMVSIGSDDVASRETSLDIESADEARSIFRNWRRSLSAKIVGFVYAVCAFSIVATIASVSITARSSIEEDFTTWATNMSTVLAASFSDHLDWDDLQGAVDEFGEIASRPKSHFDGFAILQFGSGQFGASDRIAGELLEAHLRRPIDTVEGEPVKMVTPDGAHLIVVNTVGADDKGNPTGLFATAWSKDVISAQISNLGTAGLRAGILIFIVVGGALYLILPRQVTRPLIRAARSLTVLGQGNTLQKVHDTDRGDEIGGIARAIEAINTAMARPR